MTKRNTSLENNQILEALPQAPKAKANAKVKVKAKAKAAKVKNTVLRTKELSDEQENSDDSQQR